MTRVSVITVTYRDLVGLRKTRESVAAQTALSDVQHIIIDGGSGAEVESYLAGLSGVLWRSEKDAGIYDAMNKGIALADGDILWFMNSGDTFGSPDSVAAVVRALPNPRGSWGYGYSRFYDEQGVFRWLHGDAPFRFFMLATGFKTLPHQASFFGADVVAKVGGYSLKFPVSADQLFMIQCAAVVEPVIVPEMLCNYDMTGVSTRRSIHAHFRDARAVLRASGARVTPLRPLDYALTFVFEASRLAVRGAGRLLRRGARDEGGRA